MYLPCISYPAVVRQEVVMSGKSEGPDLDSLQVHTISYQLCLLPGNWDRVMSLYPLAAISLPNTNNSSIDNSCTAID